MTRLRAGADDAAKRLVERIRHGHNENERIQCRSSLLIKLTRTAIQQGVDYIKDVIYNLRNPRHAARASPLAFSLDNFVDCFRAELLSYLADSLVIRLRCTPVISKCRR